MIPVILLAFANDKRNAGAGYLRGLTTERNAIRDALRKAEENGLCQVHIEPDATVDRIFDIFQDKEYRDRIALFHYGGHAESYSLLLETASGEKATAHSEGLVSFLAKQKSLKLVFLNGCSSQKQSEDLVAAGLPAVIGTSQVIDDNIATGLATRFYKGLSSGMTIERAWTDSIDQVKTEKGTGNASVFFQEGILGAPGEEQFPWKLYTGEGAEFSKAWNLPEAANQPLFGLELPNAYYRKLPQAPYVGLRSFKQEEAAIFFGRGAEIRKIHTLLGREQPVILLSGKKGVGKSSLMSAGLAPRLETAYTVANCNVGEKGLIDSFSNVMDQLREDNGLEKLPPQDINQLEAKIAEIRQLLTSITGFAREILEKELQQLVRLTNMERYTYHEQWMSIEAKTGKPLVILVDEVPADEEASKAFLDIMVSLFEAKTIPRGKLVLSIDDDNRGPFSELLKTAGFSFADVFLQPLSPEGGIQEAIAGVTMTPVTKEFYRLQIESGGANNLPLILFGDLAEGNQALVAPFLQVILCDFWKSAIKENAQAPSLDLNSYYTGIQSGEIMDRFLTGQLALLEAWNPEPVHSGLALDLLYLNTSALGKAEVLDAKERNKTYGDRSEVVDALVRKCKDLFLLSGTPKGGTTLGHNLLAPLVQRHYSVSLSPGQQAARILNGRVTDNAESGKISWLNETDLDAVEKGLGGMRSLEKDEIELLELSRVKKMQAQRQRKRNLVIRGVFLTVVIIFAALAAWQWSLAEKRYLQSRAGELAFNAKEVMKKDNTLAVNIARQAYSVLLSDSPHEVMQTLSEIFHSQDKRPFYKAKFPHFKRVNTAVISPDGQTVLTASEDGDVKLWDFNGNELLNLHHGPEVFMADFSPNGQQILTITRTFVSLWELDGRLTDRDSIYDGMTSLDSFSTDGMKIIPRYVEKVSNAFTANVDSLKNDFNMVIPSPSKNRILVLENGNCTFYDKEGLLVKDGFVTAVTHASFSRDGKKLLTVIPNEDLSRIIIWNESGDSLYSFRGRGDNVNAVFSPDGGAILATLNDFTPNANSFAAKLWILSEAFLHRFPKNAMGINTVDFFQKGNRYLTASADGYVIIWNDKGQPLDSLIHGDFVSSAFFSPDGKHIITASRDYTARLWTPTEPADKQVIILQHRDEVSSAVFSNDGRYILTASRDSLVRLWNLEGMLVDSFLHPDAGINSAVFSKDDLHILSVSADNAVTLWGVNGDSLHVFRHPDRVFSASFSPDGQKLLTTCRDSTVRLWSSEGILVDSFRHFEDRPRLALFTDDGEHMITGGRTVRIWSADGIPEDSLPHTESVSSISVSPDGKMILTTCNDHNAYLWNFKGEALAVYQKHQDIIKYGMFTPDGSHVLTADNEGYLYRWKTPPAIYAEMKTSEIAQMSETEMEMYGIQQSNLPRAILARLKSVVIDGLAKKEEPQ